MITQAGSDILVKLGNIVGFRANVGAHLSVPADVVTELEGFIFATTAYGTWALTQRGVERSMNIHWMFMDRHESQEDRPSNTAPSPWADDTAGVPVFSLLRVDTYSDDPYIISVAASQTPCFGGYRETSTVCGTCEIAGSCQTRFLERFKQVTHTTIAPNTPNQFRRQDLSEILLELTEPHPAPTPAHHTAPISKLVVVKSNCFQCSVTLDEGDIAEYVMKKGYRCKGGCK